MADTATATAAASNANGTNATSKDKTTAARAEKPDEEAFKKSLNQAQNEVTRSQERLVSNR